MENGRKSTTRKRLDWDEWYLVARDYYREKGDLIVPANYITPEGHKLGKWISRQRAKYNSSPHVKGTISDTEIKLLENIGMIWRLEYRFEWDEWLEQLSIYKEENGDLLIPRDYKQGIYHLGNWIVEKRRLYWRGELSKSQIEDLENLGMEWALSFQREWDEWYEDAKAYYEEHGDLLIPTDYITVEGYRLGQWISEQRGKYAHRKGKPTIKASEVQKLNLIGMVWDIRKERDTHWEDMYKAVSEYLHENGKLPMTPGINATSNGKRLDYWIITQRQYLNEGKYPDEKVKRLERIGIYPAKKRKQEETKEMVSL